MPPNASYPNHIKHLRARFGLTQARLAELMGTAHDIAACDAAYVALSRRLSLPLVTTDEPLVHHLAGTGLDVRWLGAWPEPCEL